MARYIDADELFTKFAGHNIYDGDTILCIIENIAEGKIVNNAKPLDTSKIKSKAQEDFANKVYKFLCKWDNWGDFKEQWLENGECFWLRHNLNILLKEETN